MTINTVIIKLLLAELGMTQADLADKIGLSRQSVSTILTRGTASPKNIGKLAAGLGVRPKDIIDERS